MSKKKSEAPRGSKDFDWVEFLNAPGSRTQSQRKAEQQAKRKAEQQAKQQAEDQVKREAEEQARREAEEQARREAEVRAKKRNQDAFNKYVTGLQERNAEEQAKQREINAANAIKQKVQELQNLQYLKSDAAKADLAQARMEFNEFVAPLEENGMSSGEIDRALKTRFGELRSLPEKVVDSCGNLIIPPGFYSTNRGTVAVGPTYEKMMTPRVGPLVTRQRDLITRSYKKLFCDDPVLYLKDNDICTENNRCYPLQDKTTFHVLVPEGVTEGQQLEVQIPGGRTMEVTVPAGVQPGWTFEAPYIPPPLPDTFKCKELSPFIGPTEWDQYQRFMTEDLINEKMKLPVCAEPKIYRFQEKYYDELGMEIDKGLLEQNWDIICDEDRPANKKLFEYDSEARDHNIKTRVRAALLTAFPLAMTAVPSGGAKLAKRNHRRKHKATRHKKHKATRHKKRKLTRHRKYNTR